MKVFILEDDPARMIGFRAAMFDGGTVIDAAIGVDDAKLKWSPPYDIVLLDHDLGGEVYVDSELSNTGYQFALWLASQKIDANTIIVVHSWNPDGASKMINALADVPCRLIKVPFGTSLLGWLGAKAGSKGGSVR